MADDPQDVGLLAVVDGLAQRLAVDGQGLIVGVLLVPAVQGAAGVTRHPPDTADAARILAFNRGHWTIENGGHSLLDWNWDEDRCTVRAGHGPTNLTTLRRFAIGAIKAKSRDTVAATLQRLARNVRLVFDYLGMTENSRRRQQARLAPGG